MSALDVETVIADECVKLTFGCHSLSLLGSLVSRRMTRLFESMRSPSCARKTATIPESQSRPMDMRFAVSSGECKTFLRVSPCKLTDPFCLAQIDPPLDATPMRDGEMVVTLFKRDLSENMCAVAPVSKISGVLVALRV